MKTFVGFFVCFWFVGCTVNNTGEDTTGSNRDTQINNLQITVDSQYVQGSPIALVAQGKVKNLGTSGISTPWYIEGVFFSDSSNDAIKLGGNNVQILVSLNPNQTTVWKIQFSSANVDVRLYPNFKVAELRGIYKN